MNLQTDLEKWHFSRQLIAANYLRTLSSGVMLSTTVYAPEKTGLTSFFVNDILSAATEEGYIPVYVDLSNPLIAPSIATMIGIDRALTGSSLSNTSFNFIKGLFVGKRPDISRRDEFLQHSAVADMGYFVDNQHMHLEVLDRNIKRLCSQRSVLLVFDHAHMLGMNPQGAAFERYLAHLLVEERESVKAIYGTNHMADWELTFKNPKKPLFSDGAFVHKLPLLGKIFVREVLLRIDLNVSIQEAVHCFERIGQRPGIFIALLLSWRQNTHSLSAHVHAWLQEPQSQKLSSEVSGHQNVS